VLISYKNTKVKKTCTDENTANKIHPQLFKNIQDILQYINLFANMENLNKQIGSVRIHPLKGSKKGLWALTIFDQYRLIFRPLNDKGEYSDTREQREILFIEILEVSKHYD
jgi:plasmid maintenance system killer protein